MHVFSDLQPYICTSPLCDQGLTQFITRKAWAEHEFEEHGLLHYWKCSQCNLTYADLEQAKEHLQTNHRDTLRQTHLGLTPEATLQCREIANAERPCPLCLESLGGRRREWVKHVGRHMEEIALMVLPKEDSISDSDSEHGKELASDLPEGARFFRCRQCSSHPKMDLLIHTSCVDCSSQYNATSFFYDTDGTQIFRLQSDERGNEYIDISSGESQSTDESEPRLDPFPVPRRSTIEAKSKRNSSTGHGRPFKCDHCTLTFEFVGGLRRHEREQHPSYAESHDTPAANQISDYTIPFIADSFVCAYCQYRTNIDSSIDRLENLSCTSCHHPCDSSTEIYDKNGQIMPIQQMFRKIDSDFNTQSSPTSPEPRIHIQHADQLENLISGSLEPEELKVNSRKPGKA